MTFVGKILTFFNLVVAMGTLTWAFSAYVNRINWGDWKAEGDTQVQAGELKKTKNEIDDLTKVISVAQAQYGLQSTSLASYEEIRDLRAARFRERLEEARNGTFRKQLPSDDNEAFTNLDKQGDFELGTRGEQLQGVTKVNAEFQREVNNVKLYRQGLRQLNPQNLKDEGKPESLTSLVKKTDDYSKFLKELGTDNLRKVHRVLSELVEVEDLLASKQSAILANLKEESEFLGSGRVDMIARLQSLEFRKAQLEKRLKELGVEVNPGK